MLPLKRITTEYIDAEDRIRISGKAENAAPVVIWLTQRLLQRLLPVLLQWLDGHNSNTPRAEALQGFAQQAARAELKPEAPVHAGEGSAAWLVQSVEVTRSAQAVILTFKSVDNQNATLTLAAKPLRHWLNILHDAYLKAEWSREVWPEWVRDSALPVNQQSVMLH